MFKPFHVITLGFLLAAVVVKANGNADNVCRIKAKQVAAIAYKNCVTETKNGQIEKLNKEFSQKIKAVKDEYEQELARISGKKVSAKNKTQDKEITTDTVLKTEVEATGTVTEETMDLPEPVPVESSNSI